MDNIMKRVRSDDAAALSTEMLVLIALGVFVALAVFRYIIKPVENSAKDIGDKIGEMGK